MVFMKNLGSLEVSILDTKKCTYTYLRELYIKI
jgi:hypothetical protein